MMEYKTLNFDVTNFDFKGRTIEGYASVFGNLDLGGDVIHRGAFAKTLAERGNQVKFLWQHNPGEPLGRPLEMREDDRGLFVKAIVSDTARGRDALALLRDGAINGLSIGYDAVKGGTDFGKLDDGETVRNLREIKLYEFSLVTFPMNESANVTALKRASGSTTLPIADRDRAWDSDAAIGRVRSATDSGEEPSARYRNAFFWYDAADAEQYGSYKLPFADAVEGRLTAIPKAIFAAAAALQGARGGVDIPEGDVDGVRSRISRYYARMREQFDDDSIVPPWEKSDTRMSIRIALENYEGLTQDEKHKILDNLLFSSQQTKIGRAISKANEQRIRSQMSAIMAAVEDLSEMLDTVLGTSTDEEMPPDEEQAGDSEQDKAGPVEPPTFMELERQRQLKLIELYQSMEV